MLASYLKPVAQDTTTYAIVETFLFSILSPQYEIYLFI